MDKYVVYKHTSPSGKVYIGITKKKPSRRWKYGHGYTHNKYFHNAIKKYGWNNIEHEILKSGMSLDEASSMEIELVAFYSNLGICYNIAEGGMRGCTMKRTEEEKQHLSTFFKNYFKNHEHPFRGKHHSASTKKLISDVNKKRWEDNYEEIYNKTVKRVRVGVFNVVTGCYKEYSSEKEAAHASNIKETTLRRHIKTGDIVNNCVIIPIDSTTFEEALQKAYSKSKLNTHCGWQETAVVQIDFDGNYVATYSSIKQAAKETSFTASGIGEACRGNIKSSNGYFWMFNSKYLEYQESGELNSIINKMQSDLHCRKEIFKTPILQMTIGGTPLQAFKSGADVTRKLGFDGSIISKCCRNKLLKAYNFTWKYISKEEYEEYKNKFTA